MGQIYQIASSIVIWLGGADNTAIEAFANSLLLPGFGEHRKEIQHDIARSKVVWQLFFNPWFYRAWTFQELVLSQSAEIRCGHRSVSWSTIERFVTFLKMQDVQVKSSFGHREATMATIENFLSIAEAKLSQKPRSEGDPPRLKFVELRQSQREAKSTDPREYTPCLAYATAQSVILSSQTTLLASWIYNFSLLDICCLLTDLKHCAWSKCQPTTQHYLLGHHPGRKLVGRNDMIGYTFGLTKAHKTPLAVSFGKIIGHSSCKGHLGVSTNVRKVPGMKSYRFQNHFGDDIPAGNFSSTTKILFGSDLAEETNEEFIDGLMFEMKWQRART